MTWAGRAPLRERIPLLAPGGIPLNTAVSGIRTAVRTVVGIALLPMLISRIGATETGLFVFATTLTGYFTAVELGLATSVTKYVAEYRATGADAHLNTVMRGSTALMAGLGLLIALGLTGFAFAVGEDLFGDPAVRSEAIPTLLVAAGTAILYWPSRIGVAALEGLERYDLSAFLQIVSSVITLGVLYWITGFSDSVPLITAVFGAILVLEGVAAAALAWPHLSLKRGHGRWTGRELRPMLGFGAGLFVIGISDTLVYSLDRTIVAGFVGAAAIVAYEAGLRPQNGVRAISSLAGGALLSPMSRLFAQGKDERARELVLIASFIGVIVTTPIAILAIILAKPFVGAWLGTEYERYAVYVQIFTSYWIIHSNTGALSSAITGIGKLRVFVWLTVVGAVVTLALSIALTAAWGTVGVIWGTVIPAFVGLPIWMHLALRQAGIPPRVYLREVVLPAYVPIALWTAACVGAAVLLDPRGWAGVVAFGGAALAIMWIALLPITRRKWIRAQSFSDDD